MRAMGARRASSAARLVPRCFSATATTLMSAFWESPLESPSLTRLCMARQENEPVNSEHSSRDSASQAARSKHPGVQTHGTDPAAGSHRCRGATCRLLDAMETKESPLRGGRRGFREQARRQLGSHRARRHIWHSRCGRKDHRCAAQDIPGRRRRLPMQVRVVFVTNSGVHQMHRMPPYK
jgi:hypothetical protein